MIVAKHKFKVQTVIDGVTYTAGQVVEFDSLAAYASFMAKVEALVIPDEDKGTDPLIAVLKAKEAECQELYYRMLARQIKAGLLNETPTKQRNVDTAISVFSVPLKQGRIVAAIFGIRGITQGTIDTHTPYITAQGLLKLRNALNTIAGIAPVATYNE